MKQQARRFILASVLLLSLIFPFTTPAEEINVLATNVDPDGLYLPASFFNFATGNGYAVIRNDLSNPANFGPGGVVGRSVSFSSADVINSASLNNVDVVVLAPWNRITAGEQASLIAFVQNGGGLLVAGNYAEARLATSLGAPAQSNWGTSAPLSVNPASPIINGPFGLVSGSIGLGACSYFTDVGPNGVAFLMDKDGKIIGASFQIGNGHVVVFTDEEMFLNAPLPGDVVLTAYSGQVPGSNNETLFMNAFAYVIPAAVPEPGTVLLLGLGLAGVAVARKKLRK